MRNPTPSSTLLQSAEINHYENFPVASWLIPPLQRPAVVKIYRFARAADDIADEGDASPEVRQSVLSNWLEQLHQLTHSSTAVAEPRIEALRQPIAQFGLNALFFSDLLSAFIEDVHHPSYQAFGELEDYARRSANPIGRLMLQLFSADSAENQRASDSICTALQFINFWQDTRLDLRRGRVYFPTEILNAFEVSRSQLLSWSTGEEPVSAGGRAMIAALCDDAKHRLLFGRALPSRLRGRFAWELRLTLAGGLRVLDHIRAVNYDVFTHRPTLGRRDLPQLFARAIRLPHS